MPTISSMQLRLAEQFFAFHQNCTVAVSVSGLHESRVKPLVGQLNNVWAATCRNRSLDLTIFLSGPGNHNPTYVIRRVSSFDIRANAMTVQCARGIAHIVRCIEADMIRHILAEPSDRAAWVGEAE